MAKFVIAVALIAMLALTQANPIPQLGALPLGNLAGQVVATVAGTLGGAGAVGATGNVGLRLDAAAAANAAANAAAAGQAAGQGGVVGGLPLPLAG